MKGLIIYASCYGSTKQYAEWIGKALKLEHRSYKDVTDDDVKGAPVVIIGSWVLAQRLFLAKWLEEKKALFKDKPLFIYSVSGAAPGDKELDGVFTASVPAELRQGLRTYQFGGKRETKKMSLSHRFLLFIAATFIEKDPEKKAEMKRYVDNVSETYTKQLIEDVVSNQATTA